MKLIVKLIILFTINIALGQQQIVGDIYPEEFSGLHKIMLSHKIRSIAKPNLGDLRILDSKNNPTPYYIAKATTKIKDADFTPFEIISNSKITDSSTTVIFLNTEKTLNKAVLHIANYQGGKYYNLLGSNDLKQWYGVANKQFLSSISSNIETAVYRPIHFPLCSYKYLKLVFNDRKSLPINILNIGKTSTNLSTVINEEIPFSSFEISEFKKEKKTTIKVTFDHPKILNSLKFDINAPDFYNRKTVFYYLKNATVNHKEVVQKSIIKRFSLNSNTANEFRFTDVLVNSFYIEIDNQDNPKLNIATIKCFQNSLFAIANLNKDELYTINAGDHLLTKPKYDITFFKDKLPENTPVLFVKNISYISKEKSLEKEASFWQQKWFIWLIIGFAIIIVGFVVSGLLKDLKTVED